jgi:hypothetical protein
MTQHTIWCEMIGRLENVNFTERLCFIHHSHPYNALEYFDVWRPSFAILNPTLKHLITYKVSCSLNQ